MTDTSDYETLLRSMSALSQQFTQRRSRAAGTPPNPILNSRRSRSRVAKPKSTTASPINAAAYRRRATTSQQAPAVPQPTATFNTVSQAGDTTGGSQDFFIGSSSNYDRPRSWHADMQLPSSWATAPQAFPSTTSDAYLQTQMNVPIFNSSSFGYDAIYPYMSNQTWFPTHSDAMTIHSTNHVSAQPGPIGGSSVDAAMSVPSASLPALQSSMYNEQHQQSDDGAESIISDEDAESEGEGELVGMGLYDRTTSDDQQPSLLMGAGLEDGEAGNSWGKGLQLEQTWAPSAEQVPEAEPDDEEGSDTPLTVDFQSWAPIDTDYVNNFAEDTMTTEAPHIYTTPYTDMDARLPHVMGANAVYDDNGSMIPNEMLEIQHKMSNALNWYDNQWLFYPQQEYYGQNI